LGSQIVQELLGYCLRGEQWPSGLLRTLVAEECSPAFFQVVVEGLADRFDPALCLTYARVFSEAIECALPELAAAGLVARYQRVRMPRRFEGSPDSIETVFVLSRVTLGADVAVTSLVLDAAKKRFPESRVCLVGGPKNWGLFDADPRLQHVPVSYPRRGALSERLAPWRSLRELLSKPGSIVIDPDSRLTQLGLLPVCPDENYYFFESRSYGGESDAPLPELTRRWLSATFDITDAHAYIAPLEQPEIGLTGPIAAISLGVGENPDKRVGDPFEEQLLGAILARGYSVWIDKGAGGEETERVERAIERVRPAPNKIRTWNGSFAGFASIIARSSLYVGYDSAGQHVAAACGVPLVSVFAGYPSRRMFARWRPAGDGPVEVIKVEEQKPEKVLEQTLAALSRLGPA
jgi:ADP-heptose:LPS heptosyltransferase